MFVYNDVQYLQVWDVSRWRGCAFAVIARPLANGPEAWICATWILVICMGQIELPVFAEGITDLKTLGAINADGRTKRPSCPSDARGRVRQRRGSWSACHSPGMSHPFIGRPFGFLSWMLERKPFRSSHPSFCFGLLPVSWTPR